ncbi:putative Nudix hydrolase NudL [Terrisporobacter petrolearius]|uniref:NUDIX hydrolase n=1 Tax=Terrisporobacter petrolearius TaxID=1460447 RepID=UPI0008EE3633|nr:NUDIX domain-containing protein [Terrisporobacter glycolicus]
MKDIIDKFNNYQPYINGYKNMNRASVLIPLVKENGKYSILFELRSRKMRRQPGEISFPGGRIEKNETPKEACIRETCEEIGTTEDNINIISPLDIYVSHANLIIHPYLGEIKDIKNLDINKDEVDHIFLVPLDYLINYDANIYTNDVKVVPNENFPYDKIPNKEKYEFAIGEYPVWFYEYKDYVIWGITARILENFLNFIKNK